MFSFGLKKYLVKAKPGCRKDANSVCVQALPNLEYIFPASVINAGARLYKIEYIQFDYAD
jgi:hypothetical protein